MLKLPFLTHLPSTITLCHDCSREPFCLTSHSAQTLPFPSPFPTKNEIFSDKHWLALAEAMIFLANIIWRHIPSSFEYKFEHLNIIRTFKYNSKFKYKHSNLRLKHYLYYKVRWKETNKSYKTCYFGLRIPYMQSFL